MSDSLKKPEQFAHLLFCAERPEQIAHICSFVMTNLSDLLTVVHFSWFTWAIPSQLLICPEPPEQIAHICSFVLSDLSKLANEQ